MKYSVLMSVYKNDDPIFLEIALRSIYEEQTCKPDEIVVVFDGPLEEKHYEVLNAFAEDKKEIVRYYPQEINRGLGEALHIGTGYCSGDYILRMDSDDICHPKRFEMQMKYMEEHPEVDVLGSCIAEFDNDPEEIKSIRVCPVDYNGILKMSKHRNPMNHVTICMKKSALLECGGYQTLLLAEDYYLWLRMLAKGYIFANLQENLVFVRVGNGFAARRSSKKIIASWDVLQKFMLEHKMIKWYEAIFNCLSMRAFIYVPGWLKSFIYTNILRK